MTALSSGSGSDVLRNATPLSTHRAPRGWVTPFGGPRCANLIFDRQSRTNNTGAVTCLPSRGHGHTTLPPLLNHSIAHAVHQHGCSASAVSCLPSVVSGGHLPAKNSAVSYLCSFLANPLRMFTPLSPQLFAKTRREFDPRSSLQ